MTFAKDNAASGGFNRWTINGMAYPDSMVMAEPMFHVRQGGRYRLRMRNESDDIHPVHLHRHSFELTRIAGKATSGVMKDMVMLGGYQELEVDFIANNPGMTLFHCHSKCTWISASWRSSDTSDAASDDLCGHAAAALSAGSRWIDGQFPAPRQATRLPVSRRSPMCRFDWRRHRSLPECRPRCEFRRMP
jgi:hypothetical protein